MAITVQPLNSNGKPIVFQQTTSFVDNGFTTDTLGGLQFPLQTGVPLQTRYDFKIIPSDQDSQCVAGAGLAPIDIPDGGGFVTLNTATKAGTTFPTSVPVNFIGQQIVLPAGTIGASPFVFTPTTNCIQLDCERGVNLDFDGQTTTDFDVVIGGWDYRGVAVAEKTNVPAGTQTGASFSSTKTYSVVGFVYFTENPGVPLYVGNTNDIGLPYFFVNQNQLTVPQFLWNNESIQPDYTGNDLNLFLGNDWRSGDSVPSLTSGMARGAVRLPTQPNGIAELWFSYFVYGADSETNGNLIVQHPSDLIMWNVTKTDVSEQYALPYLVQYDLVGAQYPGDNTFVTAYTALLAS